MLGVDVDKLIQPIRAEMQVYVTKIDRVIELLEEISRKLDN